jgi:hypothetical protein
MFAKSPRRRKRRAKTAVGQFEFPDLAVNGPAGSGNLDVGADIRSSVASWPLPTHGEVPHASNIKIFGTAIVVEKTAALERRFPRLGDDDLSFPKVVGGNYEI